VLLRSSRRTVPLLVALAAGCGPGSPGSDAGSARPDGRVAECAPGLKPHGPACLPIFDECKEDEVPLLGGGCKKVGVEECTPAGGGHGIKGPPDWTCQAVGPACGPGWALSAAGWCEPVLPEAACGSGMIEVIGDKACQPIGDCGSGTWGKIATMAKTTHVDQSAAAAGADGSAAKPFPTIAAAVAAAQAGGQLAVAAGTYKESVVVDKPLAIEGRCAAMVKIVGTEQVAAAIVARAAAITLRGVTVSGARQGVRVEGQGREALLEGVAVEGCGQEGVVAVQGARVTLRRAVVAKCAGHGVRIVDAQGVVEASAVRDTAAPAPDTQQGSGLLAEKLVAAGKLTVRDAVVRGNRGAGIVVSGAETLIERTLVSDTVPAGEWTEWWTEWKDGRYGCGVELNEGSGTIRDSVVAGNRLAGIRAAGSNARIERVLVRDTRPDAEGYSQGIVARSRGGREVTLEFLGSASAGNLSLGLAVVAGRGTLRDVIVADNGTQALVFSAAKVTVSRAVVRDTLAAPDGMAGYGIIAERMVNAAGSYYGPGSELEVTDSLLTRNGSCGVGGVDSDMTIERSIVRDTRSDMTSVGGSGTAIHAATYGPKPSLRKLALREVIVAGNRRLAVMLYDMDATLERTVVRDTRPNTRSECDGVGITAFNYWSTTGTLTLTECQVSESRVAGVYLISSAAAIQRSVVRRTLAGVGWDYCSVGAKTPGFGDGIGLIRAVDLPEVPERPAASLVLEDSLVEDSARAGLLFYEGGGAVRRSVFRRGVLAIDLEEAAAPDIGGDNVYEDNLENRVTWGNKIAPAPAPSIPPP